MSSSQWIESFSLAGHYQNYCQSMKVVRDQNYYSGFPFNAITSRKSGLRLKEKAHVSGKPTVRYEAIDSAILRIKAPLGHFPSSGAAGIIMYTDLGNSQKRTPPVLPRSPA